MLNINAMDAFRTIKLALPNTSGLITELNIVSDACSRNIVTFPKGNKCTYCSNNVKEQDKYCSECGRRLKQW